MKHVFLLIIGLLWFREIFITRAQERNNNSIKRPPVFRFPRRRSRSRFLRNFPENFNEDQSEQIYSTRETDLPRPRKIRAANIAAHTQYFIAVTPCENFMTSQRICEQIKRKHFRHMRFYLAQSTSNTIYTVTSSKDDLKEPIEQSDVAVVDPFPKASFGHFVIVFYIYNKPNVSSCERMGGLYISPNFCLTMAERKSCRNFQSNASKKKRCEINFIPLVYDGHRESLEKTQKLKCEEGVSEYGKCPKLLVLDEVSTANKRQLRNSGIPAVCKVYALCDYAFGIFGGWDNLTLQAIQIQQLDNANTMFEMLLRNGFSKKKIQLYFHQRFPSEITRKHLYDYGLPANNKSLILKQLQNICSAPRCVDSLVLYFNGPANADGTIMLWDNNGNGKLDKSEGILLNDILEILTNCSAQHIFIFADQSFAGMLTSALRKKRNKSGSSTFNKVVLVASGEKREYSWNKEATNFWGKLNFTEPVSSTVPVTHHQYRSRFTITQRGRRAYRTTIYGEEVARVRRMAEETGLRATRNNFFGCKQIDGDRFYRIDLSHNENS